MSEAYELHRRRVNSAQGTPLFTEQPPAPPSSLTTPKGMARSGDHQTSLEAAARVKPTVKALQAEILDLIWWQGPMTAKELEERPEFAECGRSTVRKRVSELASPKYFDPPRLVPTGAKRDGCAEYDLTERGARP